MKSTFSPGHFIGSSCIDFFHERNGNELQIHSDRLFDFLHHGSPVLLDGNYKNMFYYFGKSRFVLLMVTFAFIFSLSGLGKDIFKYQIVQTEVDELNKLGTALNLKGEGWPVSNKEFDEMMKVKGVTFVNVETVFKEQLPNGDKVYIYTYKVDRIRFVYTSSSGTLPNLSFDKLTEFTFQSFNIEGGIPVLNFPNCLKIDLSSNKLSGNIPQNLALPKCSVLYLNNNNLSGSLPELNLPAMKDFNVGSNKLTGELPSFSGMKNLERLDVSRNTFTGQIPELKLPSLKSLGLTYCGFTGGFPAFITSANFPNLESLALATNKLSGNLPVLDFPALTYLDLAENNFTGNIPDFKLPALFYLRLENNKLTGNLPLFNKMPLLEQLLANNNELTGTIPNYAHPKLSVLYLRGNKLEGSIPDFKLPLMWGLDLSGNKLSGEIPPFNFPELYNIYLSNNLLTGSIPELNIPKVATISLENNMLTGTVPVFKSTEIWSIYLANNKLEGKIDISKYTKMCCLDVSGNQITDLDKLAGYSSNLLYINVKKCRLTFEDLEMNMDVPGFSYEEQDSIEHTEEIDGNKVTLTVITGGVANKYQWMKSKNGQPFVNIDGATQHTAEVELEDKTKYTCKVTNTIVPKLTLYSKKMENPSCISIGSFEICAEDGPWESAEENELANQGTISVNELLFFDGTMTIDTAKLSVKAEGEFYMKDIPVPGGSIGKYSFCSGEYELKLMGDSGVITNFMGPKLKNVGKLFGVALNLTSLELVGGRKANGIKMDCEIKIPGISGSCSEESKSDTSKIELSGIEFSTDGVSLEGVKITDLGMLIKGYCLKSLEIKYDSEKDVLVAGASVALPFGEIGGGIKLNEGLIDSIAWRLEATKPPFVLGTTTIGIKGFFGHISNITEPEIEIELGGIFCDITSDNFYLIEASGRTVWPSVFEVKGEGKFLKPPLIEKPYQVNGGVSMTYDHPMKMFTLGFNGKIGTEDEKTWLIEGDGKIKLSNKFSPPVIAGQVNGKLTLPKFADKFPYNWLNSMFKFPVTGTSDATFVWGKGRIINGNVTFQPDSNRKFGLSYVVDLNKKYGDDDFLYFETQVTSKSARLKSGTTTFEIAEKMTIPKKCEYAVIGIHSDTKAPGSTLTNPSGKAYTVTSIADKVYYSASADGKDGFWTINTPVDGVWSIDLQNPASTDSVYFFVKQPPVDLKIAMVQTGNNVTVSWDPALFNPTQKVFIMLDDDRSGYDGFSVAEGPATSGRISFTVSDSLSACSYNLFAQVTDEKTTVQSYVDGVVRNQKAILTPPVIISATYSSVTGKTTITFENSKDLTTAGYILDVTDKSGKDSTCAILNYGMNTVTLAIKDYMEKTVKMTSFDKNGLKGCPSDAKGIYLTANNVVPGKVNYHNEIVFYPNPTTGRGTVRYSLGKEGYCEIFVTDYTGRLIAQTIHEQIPAGVYSQALDFSGLPNGIYLIVMRTKENLMTAKCILNRSR